MARFKEEDEGFTQTTVGPIKWMAPEAIIDRRYSQASDAFSFGVLLWVSSSEHCSDIYITLN